MRRVRRPSGLEATPRTVPPAPLEGVVEAAGRSFVSHTIERPVESWPRREGRRPSGLNDSRADGLAMARTGCGDARQFSASQIIFFHAPTPAPGREPPAIGVEGHADRSLLVSGETASGGAGRSSRPRGSPPPLIPRRQPPAVWAEGHAIGRPIVDADESKAPEDLVACRQSPRPSLRRSAPAAAT